MATFLGVVAQVSWTMTQSAKGIGPARLETAGKLGVPLVLAPGGLDNAVFSPYYPMPDELTGRRTHGHDTRAGPGLAGIRGGAHNV
jgi:uncharacterized protein (UPF0261 family)